MDIVLAALFALASGGLFHSLFVLFFQSVIFVAKSIFNNSHTVDLERELWVGTISFAYVMWYIFVGGWGI